MSGLITAIVGATVAVGSSAASFAQAAKQKSKASQAERDSKQLMQQARARMQQNVFDELNVPLESYERSFRENTAQQRQAIQALQGADARSLAAGIGQVGALGVTANEANRLSMGKDLYNLGLEKAKASERIRDELVGMDVGGAQDALQMERDAEIAKASAITSGLEGIGSAVSAVGAAMPTYSKTTATKRSGKLGNIISNQLGTEINPSTGKPYLKTAQTITDRTKGSPTYGQKIFATDPNVVVPEGYDTSLKLGDTGYIDTTLYKDMSQEQIRQIIEDQNYTRQQYKEMFADDYVFDPEFFKKFNIQ